MVKDAEVILVHGLWFGAWAMTRLAARLESGGFRVRKFAYSTRSGDLSAHARDLLAFAGFAGTPELHFVGHSLGGLVILKALSASQALPPGRVVLLGSPLDGSSVARKSTRIPGARKLLGEASAALQLGYKQIPGERKTGMIAGSRSIGLGLLLGGAGKPGDGTVGAHETRADGLADHLVLPVSHTGMLYSKKVARQTTHFLQTGGFEPSNA
jgi:pimeloyl-ACP methyl ester carboxylesterase